MFVELSGKISHQATLAHLKAFLRVFVYKFPSRDFDKDWIEIVIRQYNAKWVVRVISNNYDKSVIFIIDSKRFVNVQVGFLSFPTTAIPLVFCMRLKIISWHEPLKFFFITNASHIGRISDIKKQKRKIKIRHIAWSMVELTQN